MSDELSALVRAVLAARGPYEWNGTLERFGAQLDLLRAHLGVLTGNVDRAAGQARAALRHFEQRKGMLLDGLPRTANVDPRELASRSEGLSGAGIVNVIMRAAARAVQLQGDKRRVALADLLGEIEAARRIGSSWQAS